MQAQADAGSRRVVSRRYAIGGLVAAVSIGLLLLLSPMASAKGVAFRQFQGDVCQLSLRQSAKITIYRVAFEELLEEARWAREEVPPSPDKEVAALVKAGKVRRTFARLAGFYNRKFARLRPPTSHQRQRWRKRAHVEAKEVRLMQRQARSLLAADRAGYEALEPRLLRLDHRQRVLWDSVGIRC